jgi:hypothetical protein
VFLKLLLRILGHSQLVTVEDGRIPKPLASKMVSQLVMCGVAQSNLKSLQWAVESR